MKIHGNAVRCGNVLNHQSKLWVVTKTQHTQPGKGGAYMQVEMKCLTDGTKTNERFRSSETVERVYLEERPYQYLYTVDEDLIFMDQSAFDQITLKKDFIGDTVVFLQDGMVVNINFYEETPISVTLPEHVVLTVVEAEPVIKGQTATSSFKPAILDNGMRLMVPPHIEVGTPIVVSTTDQQYVERAKG